MGKTDTISVHQIRSSLAMTVPRDVAILAGIKKGDKVKVRYSNGCIIAEPVKSKKESF